MKNIGFIGVVYMGSSLINEIEKDKTYPLSVITGSATFIDAVIKVGINEELKKPTNEVTQMVGFNLII